MLRTGKEKTIKDMDEVLNINKSTLQAKILMRIKKGTCSIKALASGLNKNESIVEAVLAYMVHDGYIEEVSGNNTCKICMGCRNTSVKMYTLTSKGLQYIKSIKDMGR
jgi:predicted transcriptional regulator